jgi:lysophospholipase L1-like esterase
MAHILVFGDSIASGAFDSESGGWVNRLSIELMKSSGNRHFVYNLGVSGDNSENVVERFRREAEIRLDDDENSDIFIFAVGINDSQFLIKEQKTRVSEIDFENNINELIKQAREFSESIIFVGITPANEDKTIPIGWDANKAYKNELIQKYNSIIRKTCDTQRVEFVDVLNPFKEIDYKNLLDDGLHPNSEGHKKIFDLVLPELKKLI